MKKRFITFVLTVAMITVTGLAAEAGTTTKQITITDQDIQIYVNNNVIRLQENEEPILYNGRTFVPIRLVSETLNQAVQWDGANKAVKITGNTEASTDALTQKDLEIRKCQITGWIEKEQKLV